NEPGDQTLACPLPPLRFRRAGVPSRYANGTRLALISSGLMTDLEHHDFRRTLYGLGAQVDLSLVLFSNLESTFSVGYAKSFEKGRNSNEAMISLKLLR